MERDAHEALLTELLNPELDQSRRTEILSDLRNDYTGVITEHGELSTKLADSDAKRNDLLQANAKLFLQVGVQNDPTKQKEEEEKTKAETISINDII